MTGVPCLMIMCAGVHQPIFFTMVANWKPIFTDANKHFIGYTRLLSWFLADTRIVNRITLMSFLWAAPKTSTGDPGQNLFIFTHTKLRRQRQKIQQYFVAWN